MKIVGIIPARYGSVRLPGKPLAIIGGKSMIQRVYEQCKKSTLLADVIVATDDERILQHVEGFGGRAVLTSSDIENGSVRCAATLDKLTGDFDAVINIQGDEPFVNPAQIDQLAQTLKDYPNSIATLIKSIKEGDDLGNPNMVKVVSNRAGQALYFSRSVIPYSRSIKFSPAYFKHIGLYGYAAKILQEIVKLAPSDNEQAEQLEQLRWLDWGYNIQTCITEFENIAIDAPDDIKKAEKYLAKLKSDN